jgi:hypothetical protein
MAGWLAGPFSALSPCVLAGCSPHGRGDRSVGLGEASHVFEKPELGPEPRNLPCVCLAYVAILFFDKPELSC